VLVPLFEEDGEVWVVLTRRAQHLRTHKGEVAFPGGRQDDGETLVEAALREAREEIALHTDDVEIIGELDHLATLSSNSSVVPFVGVLPGRPPSFTANPDEVEAVLTVPLSELLDDEVYRSEWWAWQDATGLTGDRPIHFFDLYGDTIWGATGRMLVNLLAILTGTEHPG
jgi:8-oxo-dGTP pyrophosphatase MutT (NUDIX family)